MIVNVLVCPYPHFIYSYPGIYSQMVVLWDDPQSCVRAIWLTKTQMTTLRLHR